MKSLPYSDINDQSPQGHMQIHRLANKLEEYLGRLAVIFERQESRFNGATLSTPKAIVYRATHKFQRKVESKS